jgi:hypothetical protein
MLLLNACSVAVITTPIHRQLDRADQAIPGRERSSIRGHGGECDVLEPGGKRGWRQGCRGPYRSHPRRQ